MSRLIAFCKSQCKNCSTTIQAANEVKSLVKWKSVRHSINLPNGPALPESARMSFRFFARLVVGCGTGLLASSVVAAAEPLFQAHAHNDYEHARPLLDALDHGFCGAEADIFLVEGRLLVAHNRKDVQPERTLQVLYLDPLRERVQRHGGRVFTNGPEFTLLIDLKTAWTNTYPALRAVLAEYADVLTMFRGGVTRTNAVRVVISGSRALEMFAGETVRYAAYDGTLAELDSPMTADLIPWISANWAPNFTWRGQGEMPQAEHLRLKEIVAKAHARGRRVRFWGAPDNVPFWRTMRSEGVDLINTDDLPGLEKFLRSH
jgi:hypothetical protein